VFFVWSVVVLFWLYSYCLLFYHICLVNKDTHKNGKGFPYSLPSVGPRADPGVQAVSPQVNISHLPVGRLPLLSAGHVVTFPTAEHHRPLAGTKLYCLVTEAYRCEQLAQCCYAALPRVGFEPTTCWSQVQRCTRCATTPPRKWYTAYRMETMPMTLSNLQGHPYCKLFKCDFSYSWASAGKISIDIAHRAVPLR